MKKNILFSLVLSFSISCFSQNLSKVEKIDKMIQLSGSANLGEQVAKSLIAQFSKSYVNVAQEFWGRCLNEVKAEDLKKLVIPIYDKYYSEEDIDALFEFYNSPIGKKMIQVSPMLVQESLAVGQSWGENLGNKILEDLNEEGYISN